MTHEPLERPTVATIAYHHSAHEYIAQYVENVNSVLIADCGLRIESN